MGRTDALEKTLMLGKIKGRRRGQQRVMVGWHHRLDGHGSEQVPGGGEGQGSLPCCSPSGRKESDTTGQQDRKQQSDLEFSQNQHHTLMP